MKSKWPFTTVVLNDTIYQLFVIDIYRKFHPETAESTFFSSAHGTFFRIDHMLGHKISLNKFKRIEIISSIFSDPNHMKLEMNYRKKNEKSTNTWRLNNMLLKNQWVNKEIKKEIRKHLKRNENGSTTFQNLWNETKIVLGGKFIVIQAFLKKQEKSQINNLICHLKEIGKEEQTKPKVSRRKEIIKIKEEVNKRPKNNRKDQWH